MNAGAAAKSGRAEAIWYEDPRGFITKDNYMAIIPTGEMSYARQLNAVMRLTVYYAAAVAAIRLRPESFVLPVAAALVTYLLYEGSGGSKGEALRAASGQGEGASAGERRRDDGSDGSCTRPTRQNPFMNSMPYYSEPLDTPCDPLAPAVKRQMRDKFQRDLFRDTGDLFERGNSDRQFYTLPSNKPEDQTAFAEWIYGDSRRGGRATRPPGESGSRVCEW